jgi:TonB family protein
MDRARVLSRSISAGAHAAGAAILALTPLLLPGAAPEPRGVRHDPFPGMLLVGLGGGPHGAATRVARPALRPSHLALPAFVTPLVPEASIDLGSGSGASIPGLPAGGDPGGGLGSCLFGCDSSAPPAPALREAESPAAPPHPARVRVGGDIREPRKVRHVAPVYPPLAVAARVQGRVTLECVIGEDGRVSDIAVIRGYPLLDDAAIEAVRQWRYVPSLLNGVRVSVVLTVVVDFRLR